MNEYGSISELAHRIGVGHVVEALAHDPLDAMGVNVEACTPFEFYCALTLVREERDRMAALLTPQQVEAVKRDVRDWSRG